MNLTISNWNKLFLRDMYIPRVCVAITVCRTTQYCWSFLLGINYIFNRVVSDSLYYNMDIGTIWHCALVSCIQLQSIDRTVLGVHCSGVECHCVFILLIPWLRVIQSRWLWLLSGWIRPWTFILAYTSFLKICRFGSATMHLTGCFCPRKFSLNFSLNILPSDSFMSCLDSLLGYFTVEFQALQLIVLAVFGAED